MTRDFTAIIVEITFKICKILVYSQKQVMTNLKEVIYLTLLDLVQD